MTVKVVKDVYKRQTNDVMNLLKMIYDNMNKGFDMMDKHFDEMDKKWDKLLRKPETDKLKENKESDLNQVSSSDSGGNNDDTFTNKDVNLSAVEIKNEVCEVNTNDNPNGCLLYTSRCV